MRTDSIPTASTDVHQAGASHAWWPTCACTKACLVALAKHWMGGGRGALRVCLPHGLLQAGPYIFIGKVKTFIDLVTQEYS